MTGERENILGRVSEALRLSARRPGSHTAHEVQPADVPNSGPADWLPAVGAGFDAQLALFRRCAADLRADFRLAADEAEWQSHLRAVAIADDWKQVAAHRDPLVERAVAALGLPTLWTDGGYDVHAMERCDVGITACDALVAQTGSVLVTSRSAGGRTLSVLPPHHLVVATRDQMIADLPAAFALLRRRYAADFPSFTSLITGPSRTGDIERILVLGAHGPKKLTILCM